MGSGLRTMALVLLAAVLISLPAAEAAGADEGLPAAEKRIPVRLAGEARTVFTELGQLYGVRVVVDDDFPRRKLALRLAEADFRTALRLAAELTDAFWIEPDEHTVFVAANTPDKRQRYEPRVVETFELAGSKPEELAEAMRLLRELFEMRQIQADTRTNTLTIRDTPARLALAADLLAQLRREPGEVLVEALLLEVDRERAQRLGLLPPRQATVVHLGTNFFALERTEQLIDILRRLLERGLIPESFLGVPVETLLAAIASDPSLLESSLPPLLLVGGGATPFAANLPDATLGLLDLASVTRSLRRVSLRARHGEEATLFVGERFPVVLATFAPLFFPPQVLELIRKGLFVPPVPAAQYEELGLKLSAKPHLHEGGEITLRLKLDLRDLSGASVGAIPIFSNRVIEQTARLRAGEALLLSGVLSETREELRRGVPGLGRVPGLGYVFGRRETQLRSTELLVLLVPHILRSPPEPAPTRALYIGTPARFSPLGPAASPAPPPPQSLPLPAPPAQRIRSWRVG